MDAASLAISPVPLFSDNYAWVIDLGESRAAVVDPGQAEPVRAWLAEHDLELTAILVTHHHGDHVGGVNRLARGASQPVPVWGPADEEIEGVDHPVGDGDTIPLGKGQLQVLRLPGHTRGHLGYVGAGFVLTGDTLFAGGCGRLFEGTPEQMFGSLCRLAALPEPILVYCAHEYTLANLRFAAEVEPGNSELARRLAQTEEQLRRGEPTVPSTIGAELQTNPFLRTEQSPVVDAASRHAGCRLQGGVEVLAEVRRWKDGWR